MIIFQTKFRLSQLTNSVELSNFDVSKLFVCARKQWQIERVQQKLGYLSAPTDLVAYI